MRTDVIRKASLNATTVALLIGSLAACDPDRVALSAASAPHGSSQAELYATSTGKVPLNDLGSGLYLDRYAGGLYENGANVPPQDHAAAGRAAARRIRLLDHRGRPSTTGKYVLLSIGMSNTGDEWCSSEGDNSPCDALAFMDQAKKDPGINTKSLVIANGAKGGTPVSDWLLPASPEYDRVRDKVLRPLKLSEQQVQVVWVKQANRGPTISLPDPNADAIEFKRQLGTLLRTLRTRYPNLQQVYVTPRLYAGYANTSLNPEPYAYEYGFSVKWVIEAQIEQMRSGVVDAEAGDLDYRTAAAPWVDWGPYLWADGTNPRSDGVTWLRTDFRDDGTHPSIDGVAKVAELLLRHFKTSEFTACWFLAGAVCS